MSTQLGTEKSPQLDQRSRHLRRLVVRALEGGNRGHVGSTMSLIEIVRVLYDDILNHRPEDPAWDGRDRFILSKGHGCLALYAILADKGYFPIEELDTFCRVQGKLGGHPEAYKVPGVEASTGALGHGLPIAVGRAIGLRIRGNAARIFVVVGDGEINEGSVWEACLSASKHKLSSLSLLIDYNKFQSAGSTAEILDLEPLVDKIRSFGFSVTEVDGHDVEALRTLLRRLPLAADRPSAVICHTVKGKGIPFAENDARWHHASKFAEKTLAELKAAVA